ncbi:MAG: metallophosphatase family protein [Bacteroidales bacterium]|jgi:predicted phosphodiesterase|nr:metallophosphatase family protein [Bacteroidales bacterium]
MKIGIITDIHENVSMLERVLRMADSTRCDELACLGDITGYDSRFYNYHFARSARQCVDMIRANCRWVVPGNHDLFASQRFPSYSNGFVFPETWFTLSPAERRNRAAGRVWSFESEDPNDLGDMEKEYLKSLPEYEIVALNGLKMLLSHYIFPDLTGSTTRYVEKKRHLDDLWKFMDSRNLTYSLSGHSHKSHAYFSNRGSFSFVRAIHSVPNDTIHLGNEMTMLLLPPVTGGKGRTAFSVIDSEKRILRLFHEKMI